MSALFNDFNRLERLGRNEQKNRAERWNKGRQSAGQDQRKRIERQGLRVIIVNVDADRSARLRMRSRNGVKMRVNETVRMNVLKRRA
jgi:hypothetical protein